MSNNDNTPAVLEDLTAAPVEDLTAAPVEIAQASDTTEQVEAVTEADDRPETPVTPANMTKLKNSLRAEAEREVLDNHRAEYHEVAARKFAENGLEFTRRLSAEERAEVELQKLLAANPALAAKYAAK